MNTHSFDIGMKYFSSYKTNYIIIYINNIYMHIYIYIHTCVSRSLMHKDFIKAEINTENCCCSVIQSLIYIYNIYVYKYIHIILHARLENIVAWRTAVRETCLSEHQGSPNSLNITQCYGIEGFQGNPALVPHYTERVSRTANLNICSPPPPRRPLLRGRHST